MACSSESAAEPRLPRPPFERAQIKGEGASMRFVTRFGVGSALAVLAFVLAWPVTSLAAEMRGITATEIKIGQPMPYSGPVAALDALGNGGVAHFTSFNQRGGLQG